MSRPILLDNTVLSNLALVGRVDLVMRLWAGRVATTSELGILVLGVRRGLLTLEQANRLLDEMIAGGYRSPLRMLDELV
jgi:predicted nucleic acid-binding protein